MAASKKKNKAPKKPATKPRSAAAGTAGASTASAPPAACAAPNATAAPPAPAAAAKPPADGAAAEKPGRRAGGMPRGLRRLLVAAALLAAWIYWSRWREAQEVDPVAVAVDRLNDTLRSNLNLTLPDLPDLDLSDTWSKLNETVKRRLNVSLPDIDALPDLVDSLILGINVTSALGAIGRPFGAATGAGAGTRPGQLAAARGLRAKHPVVIIPGFVTSGLELWEGQPCAAGYFRQSLWAGGTFSMGKTLLADKACWLAHMSLDPVTGGDPPGIKLRAVRSLEAVDWFVPGYWVFSKVVQSLADIGYDNSNLVALAYDWRLPLPLLEARDAFFTRARAEVELQHSLAGVKPVIVSHSYGAEVTTQFLHWAEAQSPGWAERHVHAYVNLAGTLLGVPKAIAPLLSGETRDTSEMAGGLAFIFDSYLSRAARAQLARSWGSLLGMLPVGGPAVWGNATWAPDDVDAPALTAAGRSLGGVVARIENDDGDVEDAIVANNTGQLSAANLELLRATLTNWVGGGGAAAAEGGAGGAAEGGDEEVRFLDIDGALLELASTAGLQFTRNMARWSAAAAHLDLAQIIDKYEAAEAQIAGTRDRDLGAARGGEEDSSDAAGAAARLGAQQEGAAKRAGGGEGQGTCSGGGSGGGDDGDAGTCSGGGGGGAPLGAKLAQAAGSILGAAAAQAATLAGGGSSGQAAAAGREAVPMVDITRAPLPNAPSLRIYCLYGVGIPTERGYHYLRTKRQDTTDWSINKVATDAATGLDSGCQLSDGDGTVPLLSLGALCEGGWRTEQLNPGGAKVVVREYPHKPVYTLTDPRGGPGASSHVELLGNDGVLADLLRIASGAADGPDADEAVGDLHHSKIREIAARINWGAAD